MSAKRWKKQFTGVDPLDFSPGLLRIQAQPPTGEPVKIKLSAYQFQKYGMVEGRVAHLSADANDTPPNQQPAKSGNSLPFAYRALIDLKAQHLIAAGVRHSLAPGMQVTAEIHLGTRTILEYLLSPVLGAFQEAGRER